MGPRPVAVVTSKAAQKDLLNIKSQHADLVEGIANQTAKVNEFRQQKAAELQGQNTMKAEMEKERMVADTQQKKDALTFQQKQAELEIKRAALSMT